MFYGNINLTSQERVNLLAYCTIPRLNFHELENVILLVHFDENSDRYFIKIIVDEPEWLCSPTTEILKYSFSKERFDRTIKISAWDTIVNTLISEMKTELYNDVDKLNLIISDEVKFYLSDEIEKVSTVAAEMKKEINSFIAEIRVKFLDSPSIEIDFNKYKYSKLLKNAFEGEFTNGAIHAEKKKYTLYASNTIMRIERLIDSSHEVSIDGNFAYFDTQYYCID